jgi:TPR repeat protein/putative methionine-R-sulfoxide reductase with GAF domain
MAAINPAIRQPNRRSRVRHLIQTPAFASFTTESKSSMLELHEIINISEDGIAIRCHAPLEKGRRLNLCLDLAECSDHIYTTGQVIWTDAQGRAGLRFSEMRPLSLFRLREWLFLNAMAGVANAEDIPPLVSSVAIRPSYTDTLAAVNAVQREIEALGSDLNAALQLLANRAQTLVHATGAAVALADTDPGYMVCRASSGSDAPPAGTRLQLGSGFSGECVKSGKLLRCEDTEIDSRVDRESCRMLGIRAMIAVPVRLGEKSIGILEVFSARPNVFTEHDSRTLQRLAETVVGAVNRANRAGSAPQAAPPPPDTTFTPPQGSVLFAAKPEKKAQPGPNEVKASSGLSLPRAYLMILVAAAATIALGLGYRLAPWMQSEILPWAQVKLHSHASANLPSVLASTRAPNAPTFETASIDQLRQLAEKGDSAAQNSLGLHYVNGEGVKQNEREAARWFTKSAEQGNVAAQSKLGSLYFRGREIPQNLNQAYFWMALARANGDENSKVLAPLVAARLTRAQVTSIELQASNWLQQHSNNKPSPGR